MKGQTKVPYHCSFLVEPDGQDLKLAIAWRRIGNCDYGLYLACENKTDSVFFKAEYSSRGELISFLVCDQAPRSGMRWEEDHVSCSGECPEIDPQSREILKDMSNCFFNDWLESFRASEALKLIQKVTHQTIDLKEPDRLTDALQSSLPLQIKTGRRLDILGMAELTDNHFLYAFVPHSDKVQEADKALLEAKMHMFLELI